MHWKHGLYFVIACSIVSLFGCVDKESTNEQEVIEVVELPYVTPFTGERIANEMTMRPIIATINNHPDARPQSGLSSADVVYEMLAEGDVTRLLALYQSEIPETIGPIRSARDYFIKMAEGLDAFYIAHGYSPEAQAMLFNGIVDNINGMQYDGTLFKRSSKRVAPHNSYISGENVKIGAEKVGASLLYQKKVSYTYYDESESVQSGLSANNIKVSYSNKYDEFNSSYSYDPISQKYTRQSGDVVTIDDLTGNPISISNVLFFEMEHSIIDQAGRREIDLTSGGTAYIFQRGMMREVQWENHNGVLTAIEADGSEAKLAPGKTWIHFVPTKPGISTSVTYSE